MVAVRQGKIVWQSGCLGSISVLATWPLKCISEDRQELPAKNLLMLVL
jgi:hypothetical protein